MKKLLSLTFALLMLIACTSENASEESQAYSPISSQNTIKKKDSLQVDSTQQKLPEETHHPTIHQLKKTISQLFDYKKENSIVISHSDSIQTFQYLKNGFDLSKVYSIEFYGELERNRLFRYKRFFPPATLLILHYNDKETAQQQMEMLHQNFEELARSVFHPMFKMGGLVFELENQLCILKINTCGPSYDNLQRMDAQIAREVFQHKDFVRLHTKCGAVPFEKITHSIK